MPPPSQLLHRAADLSVPLPTCREAYCTTGYSPVLTFDVEDLQVGLQGLHAWTAVGE